MSRKSYHQFCGLARALDLLGERWTLLVIRELMLGPRRFVDLLEALPGIGPNTLTTRLRTLEADGLITRATLPPPAASAVYRLTPAAEELEPAMAELGRWGLRRLHADDLEFTFRPEWMLLGLKHALGPNAAQLPDADIQFLVDDTAIVIQARDGRLDLAPGVAQSPDLTLRLAPDTIKAIGVGELTPAQAVQQGRIDVDGPNELLTPLLGLLEAATARG